MWNLVDYKIFRFSCWGHELFLAVEPWNHSLCYFQFISGLQGFLRLLCWTAVSWKLERDPLLFSRTFSPGFSLPLSSTIHCGLYSPDLSRVSGPLLNSGEWHTWPGFSLPAYQPHNYPGSNLGQSVLNSFVSPLSGITLLPCLKSNVWEKTVRYILCYF